MSRPTLKTCGLHSRQPSPFRLSFAWNREAPPELSRCSLERRIVLHSRCACSPADPNPAEQFSTFEQRSGHPTLVLQNVDPGTYTAVLMPQPPWYVQSASYAQTNVLYDDMFWSRAARAIRWKSRCATTAPV